MYLEDVRDSAGLLIGSLGVGIEASLKCCGFGFGHEVAVRGVGAFRLVFDTSDFALGIDPYLNDYGTLLVGVVRRRRECDCTATGEVIGAVTAVACVVVGGGCAVGASLVASTVTDTLAAAAALLVTASGEECIAVYLWFFVFDDRLLLCLWIHGGTLVSTGVERGSRFGGLCCHLLCGSRRGIG